MAGRSVDLFDAIRTDAATRLVEGRASLRLGLAQQDPELARVQVDAVLDRIVGHMAEPGAPRHRAALGRWVAYHLGEGFAPEGLVQSIVTAGDVVAQVARRRLPADQATAILLRDVARTTVALARIVVGVLGDELAALSTPRPPSGSALAGRP